jgi:nitroimidazol reductase NimA-like FMN-containing flavoprotein (pyridoxamine 5'-phosphate oxidase superfamily)
MRREVFRADEARALALLERAPYVHVATTTPEGAPVIRALDFAVVGRSVVFHGAGAGEKARCLGRPAVVSAVELVAHVPSWMSHPTDACPASTLYRSVQVHGTLAEVVDPAAKAAALEALMRRWQPEGRYDPIDPGSAHYAQELRATLVFAVSMDRVDGKDKLLQNRPREQTRGIVAQLLARATPGDAEAVRAIREANPWLDEG